MKHSAGILLYKFEQATLQVLLVHPGGPFWAKKDAGAWSIPKGEVEDGEDKLQAAQREFAEETGQTVAGEFLELATLKQKSGKLVHAWALQGDLDVKQLKSNSFEMEWPPKSGKMKAFPEVDKAAWFGVEEALLKILPGQQSFIIKLQQLLAGQK